MIRERCGRPGTLTPKKPFTLAKSVQLTVSGTGPSGLHDLYGRRIDGDHNGQAGNNAVAILSRNGVTIDEVELARTTGRTSASTEGPKGAITTVTTGTIGGPLKCLPSIARKARPSPPPHH